LIVDDVALNRETAKDVLEDEYELWEADSARAALDMLEDRQPDLILLDIVMPEMDGYEAIKVIKAKNAWHKIPVIFLTGNDDSISEIKGFDLGAADFIKKPFVPEVMKRRIKTQMELYLYKNHLEEMVDDKCRENERMQDLLSVGFAELVECRDGITGGHIKDTYIYFKAFIEELRKDPKYKNDLTDEFVRCAVRSAPLHDVGKIAISDDVLRKAGGLDSDEFDYMKSHTIIGGQTFHKIRRQVGDNYFIVTAEDMATYHHERWDGKGYPKGLKGEEIPLSARIMSIVDVYDALTSKRPYKEPYSHEKAMAIIVEGRGDAFDPDLTDRFIAIAPVMKDCLKKKEELKSRM
jgi:putative two-component system response regulator